MQSAQTLNMSNLDEWLKARDEFLLSTHRHIEGHTLLQTMFKGCHAIKFAADWKRRGERPGGKKFKTNFARSIYDARTGRKPPHPRHATAEDKNLFKKFKLDHHKMVASRNDLLNLYWEVRLLCLIIIHNFKIWNRYQFGICILLEITWDVEKIRHDSKTFRPLLKKLSSSTPPQLRNVVETNKSTFEYVLTCLGGNETVHHVHNLLRDICTV